MRISLIVLLLFNLINLSSADNSIKVLMTNELKKNYTKALKELKNSDSGNTFVKLLFSNEELMKEFLCAGIPVDSKNATLLRLAKLYKERPNNALKSTAHLRLAVAIAYQVDEHIYEEIDKKKGKGKNKGSSGDIPENRKIIGPNTEFLDKFDYFAEAIDQKKLQSYFYTLHAGSIRQIVDYGKTEDLRYMQKTFNLPLSQYTEMHGAPPWSKNNLLGSSIHSGRFHRPYCDAGMSRAQSLFVNGAVCGGKSRFAVFHALSRGIPAVTVSLTAHCGFGVCLPDKGWTWCYGAHKEGSLKEVMFNGRFNNDLVLVYKVNQNFDKFLESMTHVWKAETLKGKEALQSLYKATEVLPYNVIAWNMVREEMKKKSKKRSYEDWKQYIDKMTMALKDNPYHVCYPNLELFIHKKPLGKEKSLRLFAYLLRKSNIGFKAAGIVRALCRDLKCPNHIFIPMVLEEFITSPYLSSLVSSLEDQVYDKPEGRKWFRETLQGIIKKNVMGGNGKGFGRDQLALFMKQAKASEDANSLHYFRKQIVPLFSSAELNLLKKVKAMKPFSGSLLSQGGMVIKSSKPYWSRRYNYPKPLLHEGILEKSGGDITLDKSKQCMLAISFGKEGLVSGIVIQGNFNKATDGKFILSLSADNKKWIQVATSKKIASEWRVDLQEKNITARYAKLELQGRNHSRLIINRFAVFGQERE